MKRIATFGNIKALIEYVLSEMQKHGYDEKARDELIEKAIPKDNPTEMKAIRAAVEQLQSMIMEVMKDVEVDPQTAELMKVLGKTKEELDTLFGLLIPEE